MLLLLSALALKNIPYEYIAVNLIKDGGQQHADEYKALNPAQLVPTLIIDGHALTESVRFLVSQIPFDIVDALL